MSEGEVGIFWIGHQHQGPLMESRVHKGEKIMVKRKQTKLSIVFEVSKFQFQVPTRVSPVHLRGKVCQGVEVPTDVGCGGVHYGS